MIKRTSTIEEKVTFEDIMTISHTVPSKEVWELLDPVVDKITTEVSNKIMELNGNQTVSACFVVGGGGKVHGFTEMLAEKLEISSERVALRGEEVLKEVIFQQKDIKKDPLLVTPIGICLNFFEQKNNFIMVKFNGERLKLYDNNRLTIVDAALQAGFPNDQLFPKRGTPINFTVNGVTRIARGEAGEPACVMMNDAPANINTPLEPNCEIVITPSTAGEAAVYRIEQLEEYNTATVSFFVNGRHITCPKFVEVNGSLEPGSYEIQEGDAIETRSFYTVSQVAEFMDVKVDLSHQILVNNREATMDSLVYENFNIDWTTDDTYVPAGTSSYITKEDEIASGTTFKGKLEEVSAQGVYLGAANAQGGKGVDNITSELEQAPTTSNETQEAEVQNEEIIGSESADFEEEGISKETSIESTDEVAGEKVEEGSKEKALESTEAAQGEQETVDPTQIVVIVNGEPVTLSGKTSYIFVDIFDRITFDLTASRGRAIATILNGENAQFAQEIHNGDKIELYWKEK